MSTRSLRPDTWSTADLHAALKVPQAEVQQDFDAIYEEHCSFVWRTALHAGMSEASIDDVVQDVFVVVHRRLGDYDGSRPIRAWLYGIVLRVVASHRRSFRRKGARLALQALDGEGERVVCTLPRLATRPRNAEALRLVLTLLDQLDPDKREVLVLSQVEEMSVPEIADCLGINVNTAYTRLRAAKREFDAAHARHEARSRRRLP